MTDEDKVLVAVIRDFHLLCAPEVSLRKRGYHATAEIIRAVPRLCDRIEAQAAEIEKLRDLLRDVLPFTATFSVGCHGEKCRNQWCHSCYDEDDAKETAMRGLHAYENARKALEQST